MTKRSVKCLSAALLFGAALLVGACGDDSDSSPPTEGEGEGEGTEGEGEGEGEGQCDPNCQDSCNGKTDCIEACPLCPDPCMECINACGGFTGDPNCLTSCIPDPCSAEGEGEGEGSPDYCLFDPHGLKCQALMLEPYQWFNGTWNCEEGDICADYSTTRVRVGEWDEALGVDIYGFIGLDARVYFKLNELTQKFEAQTSTRYVLTGTADPETKVVHLLQDVDYGEGPIRHEFVYLKQE